MATEAVEAGLFGEALSLLRPFSQIEQAGGCPDAGQLEPVGHVRPNA